jgi:glycosyltransferase involved in cell wall biosynthesis
MNVRTSGKLAVIGLSYPFRGGISHYSTLLVRNLRRRYEVDFITFSRQYPEFLFPGTTQYDESANRIDEPNERLIDSVNPISWLRTAKRLNRQQPDLVVINWWHPFFALAYGTIVQFLSRSMRDRVCFLCHNVVPHERHLLERILCWYAFRHVRHFIVHSEEDKQKLHELKPGVNVERNLHPIYSLFPEVPSIHKAAARERLGLPRDRAVVLFFGLIRPYKGLAYLIEAMPQVLRSIDCSLLVAGEFYDDKSKYTDLVAYHGLHAHVRIEGKYINNEEVGLYFGAADVVVLPYVEASQSGIVPIAYGFNTPVISTRVGGLPEAVAHGKTGFLVEPGDAGQLAEAIIRYYEGGHEPAFREAIKHHANQFDCDEEIKHIELFMKLAAATTKC